LCNVPHGSLPSHSSVLSITSLFVVEHSPIHVVG